MCAICATVTPMFAHVCKVSGFYAIGGTFTPYQLWVLVTCAIKVPFEKLARAYVPNERI